MSQVEEVQTKRRRRKPKALLDDVAVGKRKVLSNIIVGGGGVDVAEANVGRSQNEVAETCKPLGFPLTFGCFADPIPDPTKVQTVKILRNPTVFKAGVRLIDKFVKAEMTPKEILDKMGFIDESSLDLGEINNEQPQGLTIMNSPKRNKKTTKKKKSKKSKKVNADEGEPENNGTEATIVGIEKNQKDIELEEQEEQEERQGMVLIREFVSRKQSSKLHAAQGQQGEVGGFEEEDLSQNTNCYQQAIPGYKKKKRAYRKHCKKIVNMTIETLVEYYMEIRPILRKIFEGKVSNARTDIYLQGNFGLKMLQEMCVSIPFDHTQTTILINMLLEYFVPDIYDRPIWSKYISYVLLPEALLNIYALANNISYEKSEKEMRYKGCYDDGPESD